MAVTDISSISFGDTTYNLKDPSKYEKPSGGIPYSDLESSVKASLNKADSALQESDIELLEQTTSVMTAGPAAIATFDASVGGMPLKTLSVNIEPVQDLHGQASPWPAGGGVNKLPSPTATSKTANGITITVDNGVYTITGTATALAEIIFDLPDTVQINAGYKTAYLNDALNSGVELYYRYNNTNLAVMGFGGSLNRVSNPYAETFNVNRLRFLIASGTVVGTLHVSPMLMDGTLPNPTSFVPYSNICPISGWTGANVTRTGKNLINPALSLDSVRRVNSVTYENGDNEVTITSTADTNYSCLGIFYFLKAGTYAFKFSATSSDSYNPVVTLYRNGNVIIRSSITPNNEVSFTLLEDIIVEARMFASTNGNGIVGRTVRFYNMQLELGSTATAYEPYQGTTIPISWQTEAGTVYGGTLDVTSGVMTVNRAMVDLESLNWGVDSTSRFYNTDLIANFKRAITVAERATGLVCSVYKPSSNLSYSDGQDDFSWLRGHSSTPFDLIIKDTHYTTTADFKAAMSSVQLCYELATPIEITLTAQQIDTLLGTNNIWADCGDVTVTYGGYLEILKKTGDELSELPNVLTEYRTSAAQDVIDAGKLSTSSKGVAGGVAELDANGKVPVAQCPIEEDVAQATTDWLDEHVSQETGYVLDDTLTVAGAAADAKKTGDELSGLKSAFDDEVTDESLWRVAGIIGGVKDNGAYSAATIRLSTRRFDYFEFEKCRTINGYAFIVAAWDANNTYLGKYNGSAFDTNSSGVTLTSFDFSQYPDYSFVIALLVQNAPNTTMQISDGVNCIFTKNHLDVTAAAFNALSDYSVIMASGVANANQAIHIPCELKSGETIFVRLMVDARKASVAGACYHNDILVKSFLSQKYSDSAARGSTAKYTLTSDCNEVRLYSDKAYQYEVRRVIYSFNPLPVTEQLDKTTSLAFNNESLTAIAADSESAQILGETAVEINRQFIPAEKMKMVFLDNNYKYFSVANIKLIIDSMSQSGLNYLVLGFGGSGRGLCFELDDMHITSYGITYDLSNCLLTSSGKYLSESDMETIISYAESKNIDVIPSFTMPGHFRPFLNYQPRFRYGVDNDMNSLDINNPQARDYGYKCAELYLRWFAKHGCKYWLFGADEFGNITNGYYNLRNAGNYNYALFINQIAYIAAKYRMIPLAWNDAYCIDGSLYPFINRRVPVLYWRKATVHWATPSQIASNGNPLINSSDEIYWVANGTQVTEQTIRAFNVHQFEDGTTVADPLGACFCIWIGDRETPALDDDGDGITTAVLPLIRAFGETITPQFT